MCRNREPSRLSLPVRCPHCPPAADGKTKLRSENPSPALSPAQAPNKSCPMNAGVKVLIHQPTIVAILPSTLRSGPRIMRFLCTWWLHRAANQKQNRSGQQDMPSDGCVAWIDPHSPFLFLAMFCLPFPPGSGFWGVSHNSWVVGVFYPNKH